MPTAYVTVTGEGGVEEIELSDESLTLYVGEGYELEAYAYPEDADDTELVFSSSNENVVTVDEDGYLEALKEGRVTITVKTPLRASRPPVPSGYGRSNPIEHKNRDPKRDLCFYVYGRLGERITPAMGSRAEKSVKSTSLP